LALTWRRFQFLLPFIQAGHLTSLLSPISFHSLCQSSFQLLNRCLALYMLCFYLYKLYKCFTTIRPTLARRIHSDQFITKTMPLNETGSEHWCHFFNKLWLNMTVS
jgi:hypothetical protein